ncbi:MAG: hypothetical protein KC912_09060 [Proteobacteria bacterium]|nr:hypothetical protein [Pseudomonadota bacterium]
MLLGALRSLFADLDWQASPTAAALESAVDGTDWTIEGSHHIGRLIDGLPCRVLRDSEAKALVANVRMQEPWAFVFRGESAPLETAVGPTAGTMVGYQFSGPEAFLRGLAGGPQVSSLLEALREDGVQVEMHEGRVGLTQRGADPDEAPILGDAAIALAGALREAWNRMIERPLRKEGLVWTGATWESHSRHASVTVEPGRRLAIRARFTTVLSEGSAIRARQGAEAPAPLPGGLGHSLATDGEVPDALFEDEDVGEALLALLLEPGSRVHARGVDLRFRPWPVGRALTECFDALELVQQAVRAPTTPS